ncbi:DUF938 domain-containing protein [Inhella gelatinilytica]|uniref:DUF938 domain-containing protein n=1 Tax=Inhella gelatinilytica TaxID=2795030 RepID=A0A931NCM8_9BURK|nr:DUF938 domain-containing protein [Inhella gelatinilytica]MBH9551420.1 DUF938 domain-containing protein [Inhella gelatinilytica]
MSFLRLSPAAERNKQPILEALQQRLPPRGVALEVASGTGQHALHFLGGLGGWTWLPSDGSGTAVEGLQALRGALAPTLAERLQPARLLDVSADSWPLDEQHFDLIYCANLLHASPWPCCRGLMRGVARHLAPEGLLVTYGPYLEKDVAPAPSNLAFDADLKLRNPEWGLRELDAVRAEGGRVGLQLQERVSMPANNLLLFWAKGG